ncbi:hypothetical protein WA158_005487 [Blastocystis sp. Blastoise]
MGDDTSNRSLPERIMKRSKSCLLTILSSKYSSIFICGFLIYFAFSVLLLTYSVNSSLKLRVENEESYCSNEYSNNLGGKPFDYHLCIPAIDVVYTWVNGSDPIWFKQMYEYKKQYLHEKLHDNETLEMEDMAISQNRYRDNNELKYSFRSLFTYAPWIRKVYLVTNGQIPSWLDINNKKIQVVTHEEIFTNKTHLPTFSSPAIETHLHQIPGLSDWFLYFNDDVMLGSVTWPQDFLSIQKGQKFFESWETPKCADYCNWEYLGDGYCDSACNVASCLFDLGDCKDKNSQGNDSTSEKGKESYNYGHGSTSSEKPVSKGTCKSGCPSNWIGDGTCDRGCNNKECGFDGFDCGINLYGVEMTEMNTILDIPLNDTNFIHGEISKQLATDHPFKVTLTPTSPEKLLLDSRFQYSFLDIQSFVENNNTISEISFPDDFEVYQSIYSSYYKSLVIIFTTIYNTSISSSIPMVIKVKTLDESILSYSFTILRVPFSLPFIDIWSPLPDMTPYYCSLYNITQHYSTLYIPIYTDPFGDIQGEHIETVDNHGDLDDVMMPPAFVMLHPLGNGENNTIPEGKTDEIKTKCLDTNLIHYLELYSKTREVETPQSMVFDCPFTSVPYHVRNISNEGYITISNNLYIPNIYKDYDLLYTYKYSQEDLYTNNGYINLSEEDPILYPVSFSQGKEKNSTDIDIIHGELLINDTVIVQNTNPSKVSPISRQTIPLSASSSPETIYLGSSNIQTRLMSTYPNYKPRHSCRQIYRQYLTQHNSIYTNISLTYKYSTCIYQHIHIGSRHILSYLYPEYKTINLCIPVVKELHCAIDLGIFTENQYYKKTIHPYIKDTIQDELTNQTIYVIEKEGLDRIRYIYKERIEKPKIAISLEIDSHGIQKEVQTMCNQDKHKKLKELYEYLDTQIFSNNIKMVNPINETMENTIPVSENNETQSSLTTVIKEDVNDMLIYNYINKQILFNNVTLDLGSPHVRRYFTLRFGTSDLQEIHEILTGKAALHKNTFIYGNTSNITDETGFSQDYDYDSIYEELVHDDDYAYYSHGDEDTEGEGDDSINPSVYESYRAEQEREIIDGQRDAHGRRLVDTYRESLIYTIKQFINVFGKVKGKPHVPAHMPHMLNKHVLEEVSHRFSGEFEKTSSHRFRDVEDMQYAFTYFRYMMEREKEKEIDSLRAVWDMFIDTNHDGIADINEYRTLLAMIQDGKINDEKVERLSRCISPEAVTVTEYEDHDGQYKRITKFKPAVTFELFMACDEAVSSVKSNVIQRQKLDLSPMTHIEDHVDTTDDQSVAFEMINDDYNYTTEKLDSIRARHSKFICINDDMNSPSPAVIKALKDFYDSFFPFPSPFEYDRHLQNMYLNINYYKNKIMRYKLLEQYSFVFFAGLLIIFAYGFISELMASKNHVTTSTQTKDVLS